MHGYLIVPSPPFPTSVRDLTDLGDIIQLYYALLNRFKKITLLVLGNRLAGIRDDDIGPFDNPIIDFPPRAL